jgi:quinol monooxygenase YgiN
MPTDTSVIAAWTFDVDPAKFEECASRTKGALEEIPALPGRLSVDVFGNDKRSRIMILSTWSSRETWGAAQWNVQIEEVLVDLFKLSQIREFQLYFRIAP